MNEDQFNYGGARGLVGFLGEHFALLQREIATLSARLSQMERLLVPLLAFGEHSPYNPDANATAKKLLAGFLFFPTDKQLVDAFPESLQGLLALKSSQDIYTSAVRFFNEREANKQTNQTFACLCFFQMHKKLSGLRHELRNLVLKHCGDETSVVHRKWMAFCGLPPTEDIEDQLATKFARLRLIVASCALENNENCWKEVAADWESEDSYLSREAIEEMIKAAAYVPKYFRLLQNKTKKTKKKKQQNSLKKIK